MKEITDEMIINHIEYWEDIEHNIIDRINELYKIGEKLGYPSKFIKYKETNEIYIDDEHENIIIGINVFIGEWITESIYFPYKLLFSKNPSFDMKKMEQLIIKERKFKKQIELKQIEEDKKRKAELKYKTDIEKLEELSIKYPEEFKTLKK